MTATLNLVYNNFVWRIESIVPSVALRGETFRSYDRLSEKPSDHSGWLRAFEVAWEGSEADESPTWNEARTSKNTFVVRVAYSLTSFKSWNEFNETIMQDRHDINKALRDDSSFSGYNADNTSTNIGLFSRERVSDLISELNEDVVFFETTWQCYVEESEV